MVLTNVPEQSTATMETNSMGKKNPGFSNVANSISDTDGIPLKNARAILASKTRAASPAAKKANPALKKVKGK